MRIKVLFILAILLSGMFVSAQNKPFQFGFKGGMNLGWYSSANDDYKGEGVKFGGSWGFVADFFLMENYSFTTGFDVLYLNGKIKYPEYYYTSAYSNPESGTIERTIKTKYVRIPVIFTMKTNEIKKIRYYGQIGFGLSVLLTAKSDDTYNSGSGQDPYSQSDNIYDEMKPTRQSVILGAGVEIPIHKSTFVRAGITFDNAFMNVLKGNNSIDASVKHNARNSFIGIDASILF